MKREVITGSSNIAEIGYDLKSKTLQVKFTSGAIYDYYNVSEADYDALMDAPSRGKYLNDEIKWKVGITYKRIG
jgi:hypothetical protein